MKKARQIVRSIKTLLLVWGMILGTVVGMSQPLSFLSCNVFPILENDLKVSWLEKHLKAGELEFDTWLILRQANSPLANTQEGYEAFLKALRGNDELLKFFSEDVKRVRAWEVAGRVVNHSTGFANTDLIYLDKIAHHLSSPNSSYDDLIEGLEAATNKRQFIDELEHQTLLVVGDGTFEYSRVLRDKMADDGLLGGKYDITATEIQTQQEVQDLIDNSNNIPPEYQSLPTNQPNYTVQFQVDATNLASYIPPASQNKIIFNNPRGNGADLNLSTDELIRDVVSSSAGILKLGGELHIGITGSNSALGRELLEGFANVGQYQVNGKTFEVRKIHRDITRYYEGYNARTTSGGWMRGSQGPTWYYVFRLKN